MDALLSTGALPVQSTGYDIDNSVKLQDTNTEYLQRPASGSDGDRRTMTLSMWIKRTQPGNDHIFYSQGSHVRFRWKSSDYFSLRLANGHEFEHQARKFRDPSAWYHLVVAIDTTQGTASNRVKIYWNGIQETTLPDENNPPDQNEELTLGQFSSVTTQVGWFVEGGYGLDGYIAEVNYIDGIQQAVTEFGEFDEDSGIWKPKKYTGSYGSEGFYLNFDNSSSMGADSSGNGNNFNLNNVSAADQATDTPTNNFTTFNVLRRYNQGWVSFKEGATNVVTGSGNNWTTIFNTMAVNKGKWYFEGELYSNEITQMFGQQPQAFTEQNVNTDWYLGAAADKTKGAAYYGSGDDVYYEGGYVNSSASTGGDIISVAMDCDNNKVHFAVNGSWTNSSDPANNTNGFAMLDDYQYFATALYPGSATWKYNFGGYTTISISSAANDANGYGTFEYAPPSGYYSLCTKNLAEYG